jgi:hypothetical protein
MTLSFADCRLTSEGLTKGQPASLPERLRGLAVTGGRIIRGHEVIRTLPEDCTDPMRDDDVARARQLLLGIENNSDD